MVLRIVNILALLDFMSKANDSRSRIGSQDDENMF